MRKTWWMPVVTFSLTVAITAGTIAALSDDSAPAVGEHQPPGAPDSGQTLGNDARSVGDYGGGLLPYPDDSYPHGTNNDPAGQAGQGGTMQGYGSAADTGCAVMPVLVDPATPGENVVHPQPPEDSVCYPMPIIIDYGVEAPPPDSGPWPYPGYEARDLPMQGGGSDGYQPAPGPEVWPDGYEKDYGNSSGSPAVEAEPAAPPPDQPDDAITSGT